MPLDYLIRQPRTTQPISDDNSHLVDPISVRSTTPRSPHMQLPSDRQVSSKTTTPRDHISTRKNAPNEPPISIKTTTPRDPFSPRKPATHSTAGTPRKTVSPTIADRHREARQRKQQELSRRRDEKALHFANAVLHGDPIPTTHTLDEFQLEPLETSFTSTVRELAGADGLINRTYDLDLMDDNNDFGYHYSDQIPSRPMSATNLNTTQYSTSSSGLPRPSSASSSRPRKMTPMGKAIIHVRVLPFLRFF